MSVIQNVSNSSNNYEAIGVIEKLIDKIDEQKIDERVDNGQAEVEISNSQCVSTPNQGATTRTEDVVERHLTQVNEYTQKIKEKIMVSELQEGEHYGKMALEVKKIIESLLDVITEDDVKNMLKDNYNPEKLSIDMLARVINHNKLAYRTNDIEKMGKEVKEEVDAFKMKFSNMDNLKQAIHSLKEHNLPVNQKNLDKIMQVIEKVEEVKEPSNQTLVNLLKQKKPITIENLYKAKYTAEKSVDSQEDLNVLEPQIKKLLKEAHLAVNEENIQLSKMLIENEVLLNKETLTQIKNIKDQLNEVDLDKVIDKAAKNIVLKNPISAISIIDSVPSEPINPEKLKEIIDALPEIETIHIEKIVSKNRRIHLKALFEEIRQQQVNSSYYETNIKDNKDDSIEIGVDIQTPDESLKIIRASLQLEEVRLKMTFEVANRLSDKGINIALEPLENLVSHLKEMEQETYINQLMIHEVEVTDEHILKIENIYDKIDLIRNMPSKIFAKVVNQEISFTINEMANETRSEIVVEKAMKNYELQSTKPRTDLGDRIEKAFDQIESILEELKIEVTQNNIKAAKILAKNEMPITLENLEIIKIIDLKVTQVTEKLHPSIVVNMIKDKLTPLDMHIDEVLEYMEDFKLSKGFTTEEQLEKAIYALDANKTLMPEERDSLIGIYRMFSTIAKSQGAVVGFLIKNNLPLNLNYLFEAAKYIKQSKNTSHIKVNVDDDFGILSELKYKGKSIKEQIETAFTKNNLVATKSVLNLIEGLEEEGLDIEAATLRQAIVSDQLLDKCMDNMAYEKMISLYKEGYFNKEIIDIEQMTEQLTLEGKIEEANQDIKTVFDKIKNLSHLNVDIIKTLENYGVNKTLDNLLMARNLEENPFKLIDKLAVILKELETLEKGSIDDMPFKERTSINKSAHPIETYEDDIIKIKKYFEDIKFELLDHSNNTKTNITKNIEQATQLLDFQKTIKSNDEYYQIPFMIGDKLSQINIYYFRDKKGHTNEEVSEPMNIHLYFHTENMGKVQANIRLDNNKLDFDIYAKDSEDLTLIKGFSEKIKEILSHSDFSIGNIGFDFFQGKSPIQEEIKITSQEKLKKHQESKFETIV